MSFAVGEFNAAGIGISFNDELRKLLRAASKDMSFACHDYRRFRRIRPIEFGEGGDVQMLSKR